MTDGALPLGSQPLADALAAADVPALARALRMDVVVVPQFVTPDGEEQIRVFGSDVPERPYRLYLFSTADSFAAFLPPDDPQRSFEVVTGRSLAGFLDLYLQQLDLVVFDAAGPHPMAASPQDVRAALVPQPDDDEVAWITEGPEAATPAASPAAPGVPFDIALPGWVVCDPADTESTLEAVRTFLGRHLVFVRGSQKNRERIRTWAFDVVDESATSPLVAFHTQPTRKQGAAFASLFVHWLAEGDTGALESRLRAELGRGDSLTREAVAGGVALRHIHTPDGAPIIDYWFDAVSGAERPRLRFSTPDADTIDLLLGLAETVVEQARFATP